MTVWIDKVPRSRNKPWWAQCDILGHDNEFILQEKPEKCRFCEKERSASRRFYGLKEILDFPYTFLSDIPGPLTWLDIYRRTW